jgi:hypothetical protein
MRTALILAALMFPASLALAQVVDSTSCYRFSGPFFWRIAWSAEHRAWTRDSTSIVQLTKAPHPPGRLVHPGDYLARTLLPKADSVLGPGVVTSWRSPAANRIVLTWFHGVTTYLFELRVHGDSLLGDLENHADRIDGVVPHVIPVGAVRVRC